MRWGGRAERAPARAESRMADPQIRTRCGPVQPSTGLRRGKSGDMAERLKFEIEQIPARTPAKRRAGIGWRRLEPAMIFPTCCRERTWPPPLPCPDCGGCGFVHCCEGERPEGADIESERVEGAARSDRPQRDAREVRADLRLSASAIGQAAPATLCCREKRLNNSSGT